MNRDVVGDISQLDAAPKKSEIQDPLTYAIIGAAIKVHGELGPGFKESTYHHALAVELKAVGLSFVIKPEYEVRYQGIPCGRYQPDIVVESKVVLELKATCSLADEHIAQTVSYLRASGLSVALLLNFGSKSLSWRRFQN